MRLRLAITLLAFSVGMIPACAPVPLFRVASPEPSTGLPLVSGLVDLGISPGARGLLDRAASDGRFTPGELIAVLGRGLHGATGVTLGGHDIPVAGLLKGGSLLVRLPRGLDPRRPHALRVITPAGEDSVSISTHRYLIAAEPDGMTLRFMAIGPAPDPPLGQEPTELPVKEVLAVAVSGDGARAYTLEQVTRREGAGFWARIRTIDMGAPGGPRAVGPLRRVEADSEPRALGMQGADALLVLCERELLSVPLAGAQPVSLTLPGLVKGQPPLYMDLEVAPGGDTALLLDARGNGLLRVKLGPPGTPPEVAGSIKLARDSKLPLTIDLARDPDDPAAVWVLQGPNFRVAGHKLQETLGKLKSKVLGTVYTSSEADAKTLSRIVRVKADPQGVLRQDREVPLPAAFYPFMLLTRPGGDLLVSGVGNRVFEFASLELSTHAVKQALELVVDAPQLGRILHLGPDREARARVKGVLLYFGLQALPDGTLLYNLLRPGVSITSPFLAADWGVEATGAGYRHLARLGWSNLIPPYRLGILTLQ